VIWLLDTDILLDLALDRPSHAESAARILDAAERRAVSAFVAWHTVANFYYLMRADKGHASAIEFLADLLAFVAVASTDTDDARAALRLNLRDFEDALQAVAAVKCGADFIVTRNTRDYRRSPVPAISPAAALARLTA
jgi:predicted nucleic acid-binding protein